MTDDDTEQQLREEIASQKAALAYLPSTLSFIVQETGLASPETKARAQLIKELSDKEEQLELLIESKRVAAVVRLQDELHPPENSGDCPICLETIKNVNSMTIVRLYCCGSWICNQCAEHHSANCEKEGFDTMFRGKCPLCREEIPDDNKKIRSMVMEHLNKGRAWAQTLVGIWYWSEAGKKYGIAMDEEKGEKLIKQAADQRDPSALWFMAVITSDSDKTMKFFHYFKEAADLGYPKAQLHVANRCFKNGDYKEALHYTTLAASQGETKACSRLGHYFFKAECGLVRPSYILAKHYSEKCIEGAKETGSFHSVAARLLSSSILNLGRARYEGELEIPGHSPIPKILFFARKTLEVERDSSILTVTATKSISYFENLMKGHCANCRKEEGCSSFMRCSRCSGAWYCGKECQVQHWKDGHKRDCIESKSMCTMFRSVVCVDETSNTKRSTSKTGANKKSQGN